MTVFNLRIQDGATQAITSNNVGYDNVSETLFQSGAPITGNELVNKTYADSFLAGAPVVVGSALGDFPTWNNSLLEWDNKNISNPIFNAIKINNIDVSVLSSINDKQALLYDLGTTSFVPSYVITDLTSAGGGSTLIYSATPGGSVELYDIQSSDSTVNINTAGTTLDLTVPLPVIDLQNTADVTSFYLLSNPGISQNPYTFLGLNTLTTQFIGFTNDANNVYIDTKNVWGNLFYSNGTTVNVNQTNAVMGTYTVPANTLNANGKSIKYRTNGTYVCSTGDITIKVNFGGQLLATIPATGLVGNSGSTWVLEFVVNRNTSGNLNGYVSFLASDATSLTTNSFRWANSFTASGLNYTTTNVMSLTATTGATGIISWQGVHVDVLGN